jgi:DNA modification methylase
MEKRIEFLRDYLEFLEGEEYNKEFAPIVSEIEKLLSLKNDKNEFLVLEMIEVHLKAILSKMDFDNDIFIIDIVDTMLHKILNRYFVNCLSREMKKRVLDYQKKIIDNLFVLKSKKED